LSKSPDRLNIDENDFEIYKQLEQNGIPLKPFDNKHRFLLAMCLGFENKNRKKITKPHQGGFIMAHRLSKEDKALMYALAVKEEGDIGVLQDDRQVFKIAEEYASGGIPYLKESVLGELGSYSKRLEIKLFEIVNEISE